MCDAFCSAEPQVAPQAARSPFGEPARYVRRAGRAARGLAQVSRPVTSSQQSGSVLGCVAEHAVYWDAFSPRIWAPCALLPSFFGLSVRTRRDTHARMQCAAVCSCHEEPERRERAIQRVLLRPLRGKSKKS